VLYSPPHWQSLAGQWAMADSSWKWSNKGQQETDELTQSLPLKEPVRLDRDGNPSTRPIKIWKPGPKDWRCHKCKWSNFETRKK
jgi:hypothetical protein